MVVVSELSNLLSVTEETIRQDLRDLEKEGLLKRTYGGAIATNRIDSEISFKERERKHRKEKQAIGKAAARLIKDKDNLMVDASTTALQVMRNLGVKKGLTVATPSLAAVLELVNDSEVTVISTGGIFHAKSFSYVGSLAEYAARNYHVDK
jgi:DeoR/GlpR family transcriptional regulator of sugar metabolism